MLGLGGILSLIVGSKAAYAIIKPDIVWRRPETSEGDAQKMTIFVKLNIQRGTKIKIMIFIGYLYILNLYETYLHAYTLASWINPPGILNTSSYVAVLA